MDEAYKKEMCNYILHILNSSGPILWSWGAENFCISEYNEMPALKFKVNGYLHKGDVIVVYNGGGDCFEVYCFDDNSKIVKSNDDVYLNELVYVIDAMVEKEYSPTNND